MAGWVEISFDCLPLRSVGRMDVPIDASPRYRQRCLDIKSALQSHGSHNSYYLYNASVIYHLTNDADVGMIQFGFEGTVLTDSSDRLTHSTDLQITLVRETCDWLTEPTVRWFEESVNRSVRVEFDRYIAAGDLEKTQQRLDDITAQSDEADGFLGMHL